MTATILQKLADLSVLVFVTSSMLAMGMSQPLESVISPLRKPLPVLTALCANFVVAPLLALALSRIIPLEPPHAIGLLLLGGASGAPFLPKLAEAKRQGRRRYGLLASQYTAAFERKWIKGETDADEPLLGTADIQSLADLASSYELVQDTRLLPFGMRVVSQLAIMTALPLLPLVFTVLSLDSIVTRLFKILF